MTATTLAELPAPEALPDGSPEAFAEFVRDRYEPVVVRGLASDWGIVRTAKKSPVAVADYLRQFDSGRALPLVVAPAATRGRMTYSEDLRGFNFVREQSTLSAGLARMLARAGGSGEPYAFFQCLPVSVSTPGLESRLRNPLVPENTRPHVWIGSRITVAAHFDEAKNVAIVAAGRRRFTLFPPEQVDNLYIGPLDHTPAGQPVSLVDMNAPDLDRFPRYAKALESALSVELSAGDAIYIPPPWWHHVESLEPLNVLVNYWWDGAYAASALPFTALIHAIQAFRHLPPSEREAWQALVDHYAFDKDGDAASHLPESSRGILGSMTPQLAQHIDRWLASQLGNQK